MLKLSSASNRKGWKWLRWTLLFLLVWLIAFFFLFGPGRVLFPRLLISYSHVTDHVNTVYYAEDNIMAALDILWMASAEMNLKGDSIDSRVGETSPAFAHKGVTIILCPSAIQYPHLTWNCPINPILFHRIVLDQQSSESAGSLSRTLQRELELVRCSRQNGRITCLAEHSDQWSAWVYICLSGLLLLLVVFPVVLLVWLARKLRKG
ncbi:MAG: hypothetical protein JXA23_00910 [Bacteroidales bacterium]|nr:hypothetical protein [Bacteroidales bacterium]